MMMTFEGTCDRCGGRTVPNFMNTEMWCVADCETESRDISTSAADDNPTEVDDFGSRFWRNVDGKLHRDGGLPAIERADGTKMWFVDGKPHRDGGLPAIEYASGTKEWWVDGKWVR